MIDLHWLEPGRVAVAGQIGAADLSSLKAAGIGRIVNNRPNGEQPGQPDDADLAQAAAAAGVTWSHAPMAGGVSPALLDAMDEALAAGDGAVLAFCRSGTRSTYLWALARARAGHDPDALTSVAADAGYDLSPVMSLMQQLSPR